MSILAFILPTLIYNIYFLAYELLAFTTNKIKEPAYQNKWAFQIGAGFVLAFLSDGLCAMFSNTWIIYVFTSVVGCLAFIGIVLMIIYCPKTLALHVVFIWFILFEFFRQVEIGRYAGAFAWTCFMLALEYTICGTVVVLYKDSKRRD